MSTNEWSFSALLVAFAVVGWAIVVALSTEAIVLFCSFLSVAIIGYFAICKNCFASPWLYFHVVFLLMFLLGPLACVFLSVSIYEPFQLEGTFANEIARSSIDDAFRCVMLFLVISAICAPFASRPSLRFDPNSEQEDFCFKILILVLPGFLIHKWVMSAPSKYTDMYISESGIIDIIFSNVAYITLFLFFGSRPTRTRLLIICGLYSCLHLIDLLNGYRGGIFIFILTCVWLFHLNYNFRVSAKYVVASALAALLIIFFVEISRNGGEVDLTLATSFLTSSLSKGIYLSALLVDNLDIINARQPFTIFGPLSFTYDYLTFGSEIARNSEIAANVRSDLNHVWSSTLNYPAYLSGAGLGSSMIAEMRQPGWFFFIASSILFFAMYEIIFRCGYRYRVIMILNFFTFQHFVFTPRDSFFPYAWGYIKIAVLGVLMMIIFLVFLGVVEAIRNSRHVSPG
jgi:hypothetical protein